MIYRTFKINGVVFMVIGSSAEELDAKEAATRATAAANPPPSFAEFDGIDFAAIEAAQYGDESEAQLEGDEEPDYLEERIFEMSNGGTY